LANISSTLGLGETAAVDEATPAAVEEEAVVSLSFF
jgi:hypothetical protein